MRKSFGVKFILYSWNDLAIHYIWYYENLNEEKNGKPTTRYVECPDTMQRTQERQTLKKDAEMAAKEQFRRDNPQAVNKENTEIPVTKPHLGQSGRRVMIKRWDCTWGMHLSFKCFSTISLSFFDGRLERPNNSISVYSSLSTSVLHYRSISRIIVFIFNLIRCHSKKLFEFLSS